MATQSFLSIPSLKFRAKPFQCQPCYFRRRPEVYLPHQTSSIRTTSIKASLADHNEPIEFKMQIVVTKEKHEEEEEEAMPNAVQEFTWRKALHTLLDGLQLLVKWLLFLNFFVTFFATIYLFSVNRELVIPVGLFGGCVVAHFMKEISLEWFHRSEENALKWIRLGLCGFFVLVKFISTSLPEEPKHFFYSVGIGGLLQLLWYWRNFLKDAKKRQQETNTTYSFQFSTDM
ncbi:uncharacterized protein LOC123917263 [Trifolium pratense]|uniref:uncharacterized protein LOC123917263 n=1 Tax=Trifolium pratense TaxID=57577 RepID=UPI001E69666C|nr:uncharacterized protein LOC123917263 [Trifolium pratense]